MEIVDGGRDFELCWGDPFDGAIGQFAGAPALFEQRVVAGAGEGEVAYFSLTDHMAKTVSAVQSAAV
jgi:hypothetical protein